MVYECVISSQSSSVDMPVIETLDKAYRDWRVFLKEDPGESSAPIDLTGVTKVLFVVKETNRHDTVTLNKEAFVMNPTEGLIYLEILPGEIPCPGLWYGAFQLYNDSDYLIGEYVCRVMVNRSAMSTARWTPLMVSEVREFLMDRCSEDNRLLLSKQFTNSQIINAMATAVDEWNDTPPSLGYYSPVTFPWPRPLMIGTAAQLLQSLSFNQVRNNATYQGGNLTVSDSDKGPAYAQMAEQLKGEWRTWIASKKREINIAQGWGSSSIREF